MKTHFSHYPKGGRKMQAAVHVNNTSLPAFLFSSRRIDADPSGFLMSPDYFVRLNTLSRAGNFAVREFISLGKILWNGRILTQYFRRDQDKIPEIFEVNTFFLGNFLADLTMLKPFLKVIPSPDGSKIFPIRNKLRK